MIKCDAMNTWKLLHHYQTSLNQNKCDDCININQVLIATTVDGILVVGHAADGNGLGVLSYYTK